MSAYAITVIPYLFFAIFMLMACSQAYVALWSVEERVTLRNRVIRTWQERSKEIKEKAGEAEVTQLFQEAGYPKMTNVKWLVVRIVLLVILVALLSGSTSLSLILLSIVSFMILTEPIFKYSAIRLFLKWRISSIKRQNELELFTLFSLLQTDLLATQDEQVNVYHLLSESLPYFRRINGTISKFLNLWRKSPETASKVFEQDLGGETAQFLGDVLSRLHNTSRTDAIELLSEQGELFTFKRSEIALQQAEVQRNMFYFFFLVSAFVGIIWFMWSMYSLINTAF